MNQLKPIDEYELPLDRVKHSKGVTRGVLQHYLFPTLTRQEQVTLLLAAQYHDVGYSTQLTHNTGAPQKHYIYSYLHLKSSGVAVQVCRLVLHHTYARDLERIKFNDLTLFNRNPLLPQDAKLLFILNDSDMTTNSRGNTVSKETRLDDIRRRYSDTHVVTLHFKKALQLHALEEQKYTTDDINATIKTVTPQEILTNILDDLVVITRTYKYRPSTKSVHPYAHFQLDKVSRSNTPYESFTESELINLAIICIGQLYPHHIITHR